MPGDIFIGDCRSEVGSFDCNVAVAFEEASGCDTRRRRLLDYGHSYGDLPTIGSANLDVGLRTSLRHRLPSDVHVQPEIFGAGDFPFGRRDAQPRRARFDRKADRRTSPVEYFYPLWLARELIQLWQRRPPGAFYIGRPGRRAAFHGDP